MRVYLEVSNLSFMIQAQKREALQPIILFFFYFQMCMISGLKSLDLSNTYLASSTKWHCDLMINILVHYFF